MSETDKLKAEIERLKSAGCELAEAVEDLDCALVSKNAEWIGNAIDAKDAKLAAWRKLVEPT